MLEFLVLLIFSNAILCDDGFYKSPIYKYHYETQDVMNTAASNIPVHGYHVVEGGYYPYELGHGGVGIGSAALHGGIAGTGVGNGFAGTGVGSAFASPGLGAFGGQYVLNPLGLVGPTGYTGGNLGGGVGFAGKLFIFSFVRNN